MSRLNAFLRQAFAGSNGQIPVLTIASIRLGYALLLLLSAMGDIDDPHFGWHPEFDDAIATAYVVVALTAFGFALRAPFRDFLFFPSAIAFDIAILVAVMTTIERPESGFLGAVVAGVAYVLLAAANRWNFNVAFEIARFFALATAIQLAILFAETHPEPFETDVVARRLIILFVVIGGTLWAISSMRRVYVAPWQFEPAAEVDDLKRDAVEYAAISMGASVGTLCWTRPGDDCCEAPTISFTAEELDRLPTSRTCAAPLPEDDYAAALVDLPTRQALVLGRNDTLRHQGLSGIDISSVEELGTSNALIVRLLGQSGYGKLVLSGFPAQGWHRLRVSAWRLAMKS